MYSCLTYSLLCSGLYSPYIIPHITMSSYLCKCYYYDKWYYKLYGFLIMYSCHSYCPHGNNIRSGPIKCLRECLVYLYGAMFFPHHCQLGDLRIRRYLRIRHTLQLPLYMIYIYHRFIIGNFPH